MRFHSDYILFTIEYIFTTVAVQLTKQIRHYEKYLQVYTYTSTGFYWAILKNARNLPLRMA